MALGFNVSSGADYQLICKYDSRSGRMTRRDRNAQTGGWDNPDITDSFRAVFDFASANFEIGWLNFNTGSAPDFAMVPPRRANASAADTRPQARCACADHAE